MGHVEVPKRTIHVRRYAAADEFSSNRSMGHVVVPKRTIPIGIGINVATAESAKHVSD